MSAPATFGSMRSERVVVDGRSVNVWRAGSGAPALLLHGFSDDGTCWVSTVPLFTGRGMEVVAPDARGHGATPLLDDDDFTAGGRLEDIEAVLGVLDLGAVLAVGHSMGAITAMKLAAKRPDLVAATVLIDPPLFGAAPDPNRDRVNLFGPWIDEITLLPAAELADRCRAENPGWTDDEIAAWVSSKRSLDRRLFDRMQGWHGSSWRSTMGDIRCPVLVVAGELESGSAVDAEAGEWLAALPGLGFTRISGAGHSVHRDQRDEVAAVVGDFLDRVGRGPRR